MRSALVAANDNTVSKPWPPQDEALALLWSMIGNRLEFSKSCMDGQNYSQAVKTTVMTTLTV
jgi:hypothetical protein